MRLSLQAALVLAGLCASQIAAPHRAAARALAVAQQIAPLRGTLAPSAQNDAGPAAPVPALAPSACEAQLAEIAMFQPLGALVGPGGCGAADAVLLASVVLPDQTKIAVEPPATLRCAMAEAVAQWARDDVAPAAMKLGSPLHALDEIGSYECRGRDRVGGAKLSEHGRANALDVRAFTLANGNTLVLADGNVPMDFREAVRAGACARFMTVLGPGSDSYHAQHLHIDLEARRNNYKICEWDVRGPQAAAPVQATASETAAPLPQPRPLAANAAGRSAAVPARHFRRR